MTKISNLFEVYLSRSPDERDFVKKHITIKHKDRNGNGDDVFKASNIKKIDRKKENHGYEPGEDEKVYESHDPENDDGYYAAKEMYGSDYATAKHIWAKHRDQYTSKDLDAAIDKLGGKKENVIRHLARFSYNKDLAKKRGEMTDRDSFYKESIDVENLEEELESLVELCKDTLKSYESKASQDRTKAFGDEKRYNKRLKGSSMAVAKMANEEIEQIDEIRGRSRVTVKPGRYFSNKPTQGLQLSPETEEGLKAIQDAFKKIKEKKVNEAKEPWMGKDLDKPAYLRKKEYEDNKKDAEAVMQPKLKRVKEDLDLHEISKDTIGRYINKASSDMAFRAYKTGQKDIVEPGLTLRTRKERKRGEGIARAVKKLTTEDIADSFISRYVKENNQSSLEDIFVNRLIEANVNENDIYKLLEVFDSLDNKNKFEMLALSEDEDMIDDLIDFAIDTFSEEEFFDDEDIEDGENN